ncbi:asparaginyl-tRNA synthetase [Mycoplasma testudineum]|uniref:Asparagine--tRNA ligase n=1 Tax=Mycoplasma testudineum TaxID=244584 RepID=A0A4R6IFJ0_9MOLU|nr:asparagine--tRNA ligase [Mycoplasma testudineum]OYD26872.1 asparagine--tRNA ligase [Mycoplasma testudineum]TDO20407.1 asparaginyl-tRNA synthetase [Mycoplasma testudineum]
MIKDILYLAKNNDQKSFYLKGWITNNRGNKNIRFIEMNDGSTVENLQLVIKKSPQLDLEQISSYKLGSAIEVRGKLSYTPNQKQIAELEVETLLLVAEADDDFPIQKKETSLEFLRTIPHIRHRTSTLRAATLVRSTISFAIHEFFQSSGFALVASPIITSNDGEGAGETFSIKNEQSSDPFFGKDVNPFLSVTGQLHAEAYALGMQKVYTFAPTFRAENSHTTKHAAEFWMIEPEVSFYELPDLIKLADDMLRFVVDRVLKRNEAEIKFLSEVNNVDLFTRLKKLLVTNLKVLEYREAIKILKKANVDFENKDIKFGTDLATEHERYLAEVYYQGPISIINYPKSFKAFYMYQNDDNETVAAFDLLVPGIGELIGGSQRESRYDKLLNRVKELNIDEQSLQWYLDLRKYGYKASAGFGLGLERLIMYITGMENIRDVLPFPRTPNNLKM